MSAHTPGPWERWEDHESIHARVSLNTPGSITGEQGLKDQRICQCGHVFDAACGVNGCPNCHNEALT